MNNLDGTQEEKKEEKKKEIPATLLQFMVFLIKNIIKGLPRALIFAFISALVVLGIHTYLLVVINEGFSLNTSGKFLKYILMLKDGWGDRGFRDSLRLSNVTFVWILLSVIIWGSIGRIRSCGFKVFIIKIADGFIKLFSDIFEKPGSILLSLFLCTITLGIGLGIFLGNPVLSILLSILIFLSASARESSLLTFIMYLTWSDLQRLFSVNPRKPFYIDIVCMVLRGFSIGFLISGFMPFIKHGGVIQYFVFVLFAGLLVLNMMMKSRPKTASFIFFLGSSFLLLSTKAFADDGGWNECGGTFGNWIGSEGAAEAVKRSLPPALGVASVAIGFIPIVGEIKDIQELMTGVDLITGEELSGTDRALNAAGLVLPVVNGKMLKGGLKVGHAAIDAVLDKESVKAAVKVSDKTVDVISKVKDGKDIAENASELVGSVSNPNDNAT